MAALTASAQSALSDRSWDEMIVPALRKRLESESRAISKRMSAASILSGDEIIQSYTPSRSTPRAKAVANGAITGKSAPVPSTPSEKPSAIPRPSLNYSRPIMTTAQGSSNIVPNTTSKVQSTRPSFKRSRTYSQPYPFDPSEEERDSGATSTSTNRTPHPNNSILPTPVSSRPNSPSTTTTASTLRPAENKPTRIPKVTNTSKTIAINGQAKGGEGDKQANAFLTPEASPETWQVYENGQLSSSQSSLNVPRHSRQNGGPVLLHEEPPFSAASSIEVFGDQQQPSRRSMEDETPFEHWYRGDLSRNGGVGELRIGNRMEMLEIANYGHRVRQNIANARAGTSNGVYGSKRRRAGSIGGGRERDSVVFDDTYAAIDMVLDEMPLTDMEGDTETDREMSFTREAQAQAAQAAQLTQDQPPPQAHVRTVSAAGSASRIPTSQRSVSASTSHDQQARSRKNSQIPRPQQSSSHSQADRGASSTARPNGAPTETQINTPARAYAAANMPFSPSQGLQPLATSTPKRGRAKSPATPSKKAKVTRPNIRSKSAVDVRTTKDEDIAEYPDMPDDSQLADAIPTWTKPVPKGNWDEVVLPAVARKMGLDDQYEQETGVPQPRKNEEEVIPPQPGTFGITPPRPRQPREGKVHSGSEENENATSSDHWDEKTAQAETQTKDEMNVTTPPQTPEPKPTSRRAAPPSMDLTDARRPLSRRKEEPPSPAPFAHYSQAAAMESAVERPVTPPMVSRREEEDGAGCCRCVIM